MIKAVTLTQIQRHQWLDDAQRQFGEDIGAKDATQYARRGETAEQPPIDISVPGMRATGKAGGDDLSGMHAGAGDGRWRPDRQQERRAD